MVTEVVATADGDTDAIYLPPGYWKLEIAADTWDGASAILKEGKSGSYVGVDDPYNAGTAVTRTADSYMLETKGGTYFILTVSSFGGSTDNLRLTAYQAV